jgi:mono/diheme cytochrome c family protein
LFQIWKDDILPTKYFIYLLKLTHMRKISITFLLLFSVLLFQFCSSSKKAIAPAAVTYQANIQSIIQSSCTPCHIAGKGNKKSLDNYLTAKEKIDDIITRIQKNTTDHGFMPMKKDKLSAASINAFVEWKKAGLLEN